MWLIENRHGIWEDRMIPYWMAESLITKTVMDTTLKYTIGGITIMANKHMLSANMILFLFLLSL